MNVAVFTYRSSRCSTVYTSCSSPSARHVCMVSESRLVPSCWSTRTCGAIRVDYMTWMSHPLHFSFPACSSLSPAHIISRGEGNQMDGTVALVHSYLQRREGGRWHGCLPHQKA